MPNKLVQVHRGAEENILTKSEAKVYLCTLFYAFIFVFEIRKQNFRVEELKESHILLLKGFKRDV